MSEPFSLPPAGLLRGAVLTLLLCAGLSVSAAPLQDVPGAAPADGAAAGAAADVRGDALYRALRKARTDGRQITLERPLAFERDAFRFELRSGTVHFLEAVGGETFGAVFLGDGSYRLTPVTENERQHLAFLRNEPGLRTLDDRFDTLVLFFTDGTAEELEAAGTLRRGAPSAEADRAVERTQDWQRKDFRTNFYLRILEDLLEGPAGDGVFLGLVKGVDLPVALAAVDPQGVEALRIAPLLGGEDTLLFVSSDVSGGPWYLSHRKEEVAAGRREAYRSPVDALHYEIDTTIERSEDLRGVARIELRAEQPLRLLSLYLLNTLDVTDAAYRRSGSDTWAEIPVLLEKTPHSYGTEKDDVEVGLVLPEKLPAGSEFEVRLAYDGDQVLVDAGLEVFAVRARTSWYPNAGVFSDLATFDLTYHVPKRKEVVSVGRLTAREEGEDGRPMSRWVADQPIRVAGFNYGAFNRSSLQDEVSGLRVDVYENQRQIEFAGRSDVGEIASELGPDSLGVVSVGPRQSAGRQNVSELALADGLNSARLFTTYFGPISQRHVALTQQVQFSFGQSWPSLVFLPYASFLTGTARSAMGANFMQDFVDTVGYHEMAHQWWGHQVGWESYRDQWLSEGFAQFSALLAIQHTRGWQEHDRLWKEARDLIVSRTQSPDPVNETGPLTQGLRLSNGRSQAGYQILAYHKGAFVLHMLRMMMWDPSSSNPDGAFIAMMRDFTSTYAGEAPSTEDFKAVVERHMVPTMNATGDGKIDWFFDQWVYGTAIPRLTSRLDVKKAGKDGYRISGEVTFADVPDTFRALVPLYVDFGKGRTAMVGKLPFQGPGTRPVDLTVQLPNRPKKALVNAHWEVLARD